MLFNPRYRTTESVDLVYPTKVYAQSIMAANSQLNVDPAEFKEIP
jgi:hypothetical protein